MDTQSAADAPDVSGYVRRARRLADLNQRELADAVGISASRVARIETGGPVDVQTFAGILAAAGLRLTVVDAGGAAIDPMPPDVLRDRAGRRRPAHLDVHAVPEIPNMAMRFRYAVPPRDQWHHLRDERDRSRRAKGLDGSTEQLTESEIRARTRRRADERRAEYAAAQRCAAPRSVTRRTLDDATRFG